MPQPRQRNQRVRLHGVGRARDTRPGYRDPIFDELLADGWEDVPCALNTVMMVEDMRSWGVDVTLEIARECLRWHVRKEVQGADYEREQERRLLAHRHPPIVYYLRLANLVKIGFTTNLTKRLGVINPEEVMATEPGDRKREQERHRQFAALHAHGEWFRLEQPLVDHIEAIRREARGE